MDLIQGLIQPPKVQTVDDTIPTLCDRVENATLLSDRRSAVLGLKSFSRSYRETVIASGLKPLIATLKKDAEDEDSAKAILETLLILFIRGEGNADLTRNWISQESRLKNGKYPSPLVMKQEQVENESVDQFSLWIADFMTQTDELVHLFVRLLENGNFHIRLYTIQLLEAFVASRASRTREAIISLPVGVSTLVGLLEDVHEPIRDEAVLLLMALVNNSAHIQHLVAFENIFEKLFNIIQEEGGLRGSLVVSDCLSLIVNILKYNASNQILFVETGNLPHMANLLNDPMEDEFHWNDTRVLNIKTGLTILMLSVDPDNNATPKHQNMLLESHLLMITLRLALMPTVPNSVRPFALLAAADMIQDNERVQSELQKIDVPPFDPSTAARTADQTRLVPITELVMNWCFFANSIHTFEIRQASSELIKAYLKNNQSLQLKFVKDQIKIYENSDHLDDEAVNDHYSAGIFNVLLEYDPDLKLNPYKLYFASDLLFFLLHGESELEIRDLIRKIECKGTDSMDETGESMSPVQTVLELLLTSLSLEDSRVPISYLCLLIFWLFDDPTAVSSFLSDKTVLQSLISYTSQMKEDDVTVNCLVSVLLGVAYEFSSTESKVTRADFFELLVKSVGVNNYMSKIRQFWENSLFADSETNDNLLGAFETDSTGLPKVYFSPFFTKLLKDNFYQIQSALKRGPEYKSVAKISFESYEDLRQEKLDLENEFSKLEIESKKRIEEIQVSLQEANKQFSEAEEQNIQCTSELANKSEEITTLRDQRDELKRTLASLREEHKVLVQDHEKIMPRITSLEEAASLKAATIQKLERDLDSATRGRKAAEDGINKMNRELFTLSKEKDRLKSESTKATAELENKLKTMRDDLQKLETKKSSFEDELGITALNLKKLTEDKQKAEAETSSLQKEQVDLNSRLKDQEHLVSKLSAKLRELAETCKQLSKEKAEKQAEIDSLTKGNSEKMSKLESELRRVQERLKASENERSSLSQEVESLTLASHERDGINRSLSQQNEISTKKLKMFAGSLAEVKTLCGHLRKELSNILVGNSLLTERFQKLQKDHEQKSQELIEKAAFYKTQNEKWDNERKLALENIEKMKTTKSELEQKVKKLSSERMKALDDLSKLSADHDKEHQSGIEQRLILEEKLTNLEKQRREDSKQSEGLQSEIIDLQGKCKELESSRKELFESSEASALKAADDLMNLQTKYAQLSENHEKCSVEHERSATAAQEAESKSLGLEKKVQELHSTLQEQESIAAAGELKLSEFEGDLDTAKSAVIAKDTELEKVKASLVESKENYAILEKEQGDSKMKSESENRFLSGEIERLKQIMKEKKAELEEERKQFTEGSASVTESYLKKVSDLEAKLEALEYTHVEKLETFEKAKTELTSLLKKSEEKAVEAARKLGQVNEKLAKTLDSQEKSKASHKKLEDSQRVQIEDAASQMKELKSTIAHQEQEIVSMKLEMSQTASTLKSREQKIIGYETQIDKFKETEKSLQLSEKNARVASETCEAEANAARDQSKKQLIEFEKGSEAFKKRISGLEVDLKDKNNALEELRTQMKEHIKSNEKHERTLNDLHQVKSTNVSLTMELETEKSAKEAAITEVQELRKTNVVILDKLRLCENDKEEKSDYGEKDKLVTELGLQVENLKLELKDWKSKASDRSEVDDLMLLVSELDEKNSKYRAKLELLGSEFSSDEEEEEDEDGDER
ncbi:LAFA_0D09494g1_1 [Lachancea sp. 'fantastica']|nr:LAFA_0D09494g1_1 [Lachancea sp. 'fantastica']